MYKYPRHKVRPHLRNPFPHQCVVPETVKCVAQFFQMKKGKNEAVEEDYISAALYVHIDKLFQADREEINKLRDDFMEFSGFAELSKCWSEPERLSQFLQQRFSCFSEEELKLIQLSPRQFEQYDNAGRTMLLGQMCALHELNEKEFKKWTLEIRRLKGDAPDWYEFLRASLAVYLFGKFCERTAVLPSNILGLLKRNMVDPSCHAGVCYFFLFHAICCLFFWKKTVDLVQNHTELKKEICSRSFQDNFNYTLELVKSKQEATKAPEKTPEQIFAEQLASVTFLPDATKAKIQQVYMSDENRRPLFEKYIGFLVQHCSELEEIGREDEELYKKMLADCAPSKTREVAEEELFQQYWKNWKDSKTQAVQA